MRSDSCFVLAAVPLLVLLGCSSDAEAELFPTEAAQNAAQRFHEALRRGDVKAAAAMARLPFHYKEVGRDWPDQASLEANLAKELPRFQHLLAGLDRVEVFSRNDLLAGRWPRDRQVPEEKRPAEIRALGLEPHGWVARIHSEGRPGYLLVLNAEGVERLAVQMIDI